MRRPAGRGRPGAISLEGGDKNMRDLAILACTECKSRNYTTTRNKKTMAERLEKVKFCPACRKRTAHKETK